MSQKPKKYEICKDEKKQFVNPYNFVPINFKQEPERKKIDDKTDGYTGYMDCRIKCKTPIAIPGKKKEKIGKTPYYPFFEVDGKPVIPGSSIRGVIRNVFETATDSCYSTMKDDTRLMKRNSSDNAFSAGILKKDGEKWHLYEAKRYMLRVKPSSNKKPWEQEKKRNPEAWDENICPCYPVHLKNGERYIQVEVENENPKEYASGDMVSFSALKDEKTGEEKVFLSSNNGRLCSPIAQEINPLKGSIKGYLVLGEPIYNKHHESIFVKLDTEVIRDEEEIEKAMYWLEMTLEMYRNPSINNAAYDSKESDEWNKKNKKEHRGYPNYGKMKENGEIPIWYQYKDGVLILSLASIGRITYRKTLNQHVDKKRPCTSRNALCPACRVFGMVRQGEAVGSRVRFTDAKCVLAIPQKQQLLAELSSPKPSYMPFYSNATSEEYNKNLGFDTEGVTIRGRKFYWHSDNFKTINQVQPTERNAYMDIMLENSEFRFQIYFDNLSKEELDQLVWAVNFGDNHFWKEGINKDDELTEGYMMHKLGHGKPIGMGSVKMIVDSIKYRKFIIHTDAETDISTGSYEEKVYPVDCKKKSEELFHATDDRIKSLEEICNYNNKKEARYPYVNCETQDPPKNADAPFHWFMENKNAKNEMQLLNPILGEQGMRPFSYVGDNSNNNNSSLGGRNDNGARKNDRTSDNSAKQKSEHYDSSKSKSGSFVKGCVGKHNSTNTRR